MTAVINYESKPFDIQTVLELRGNNIYFLFLSAFLGIFFEILQKLHIASGTYDFFDIVIYLIATALAVVFIGGKSDEKNS